VNIIKILECKLKREKILGRPPKAMHMFCFVISVMGLNEPNAGMDKDEDDDFDVWSMVLVSLSGNPQQEKN
jgi:hypothetical protein